MIKRGGREGFGLQRSRILGKMCGREIKIIYNQQVRIISECKEDVGSWVTLVMQLVKGNPSCIEIVLGTQMDLISRYKATKCYFKKVVYLSMLGFFF